MRLASLKKSALAHLFATRRNTANIHVKKQTAPIFKRKGSPRLANRLAYGFNLQTPTLVAVFMTEMTRQRRTDGMTVSS